MLESAKRCFQSLADLIGKEVFIKLCSEYVEANLKKVPIQDKIISVQVKQEPFHNYHPSINYEWNMGDLHTFD